MKIRRIATRGDIRAACGNLIVCGFAGPEVSAELRELMREIRPLGVILFARNVVSPAQVYELTCEIKQLRPRAPLLVSVDQEGGRVARIRNGVTEWPAMRLLGHGGSGELARKVGEALGRELRAMNIDVDFAPVLDVDTNPSNPVIGDRSFGDTAECVSTMGAALCMGLQGAGVAACGKHFPGHGDTHEDSHVCLPRVTHDLERLRAVEWPPFQACIRAGMGAVMTAHVVVEALDEDRPATLSARALAPLREELGFRGVVVSDDLEMKAVADHYTPAQMGIMGLHAGVDLFLACHSPEVALELYAGMVRAAEQETLAHEILLEAQDRVLAWRDLYCRPAGPRDLLRRWVGCPEHRQLAEQICVMADAYLA